MNRVFALTCIAALAVAGCSKDKKTDGATAGAAAPIAPAAAGQAPAASAAHAGAAAPHTGGQAAPGTAVGKVLETMNSGGYTYVKVDTGSQQLWAAGPEVAVKVGDTVNFSGGSPMEQYHSKTLDRTFDVVYFVPAINLGDAPAAMPAMGHGGGMPAGHGGAAAAPPAAVKVENVEKAEGGQTVAEVFAGKAGLAGKEVKIRGVVVKFNGGIMGRNWLHLQDGSGAAGTNDLTVTTNDEATVGDTVIVTGKVVVDKDFGAGYAYEVIVEEAKVSK